MPDSFSDRGFAQFRTNVISTHGAEVAVFESSVVGDPHVWLAITGDAHLESDPEPYAGIPHGVAKARNAAHLNERQAREVMTGLAEFLGIDNLGMLTDKQRADEALAERDAVINALHEQGGGGDTEVVFDRMYAALRNVREERDLMRSAVTAIATGTIADPQVLAQAALNDDRERREANLRSFSQS